MVSPERPARAEVTVRLHPKIVEMLDAQASAAGISRQRHVNRLIQDQQRKLDNDRDMKLREELGPDLESLAIVDFVAEHPVDLGPAYGDEDPL